MSLLSTPTKIILSIVLHIFMLFLSEEYSGECNLIYDNLIYTLKGRLNHFN